VPDILRMMASDLSLDAKIDRFVDAYHTRLTRHPYLGCPTSSVRQRDIRIWSTTLAPRRDVRRRAA
jgi:hypothetical protein